MLTVKYIGPDAAVLAGSYIYSGETRQVSRGQFLIAQANHPEGFEILEGELPQAEVEQLPAPVPPIDPNADQPGGEPPTTDDEPPTTDAPVVDAPVIEEPAPTAEEALAEAAIALLDEPAPAPRRAPGRNR